MGQIVDHWKGMCFDSVLHSLCRYWGVSLMQCLDLFPVKALIFWGGSCMVLHCLVVCHTVANPDHHILSISYSKFPERRMHQNKLYTFEPPGQFMIPSLLRKPNVSTPTFLRHHLQNPRHHQLIFIFATPSHPSFPKTIEPLSHHPHPSKTSL